jgi:hypothetical protein
MTRLLSRLADFGRTGLPRFAFTWSQRVCEQIEAQFTDIFAAISSMPDIPDVHITADYTGTVNAGQLPYNVTAQRFTNTTDNTADATWSFTTDNGGITASITSPGVLNITAVISTTEVTLTSSYGGVDKSRGFAVYLDSAAPPATGTGGGTSSSDTAFSSFNSTTHAAVSDELTVTVGSSGNATLSARLTVYTDASGLNATYKIYAKWQWWNGAAWADVGTEVSSSPDCSVRVKNSVATVTNGSVSVPQTKTGLTVASSQKFRLEARNNSGTRAMYLSGTASVVST